VPRNRVDPADPVADARLSLGHVAASEGAGRRGRWPRAASGCDLQLRADHLVSAGEACSSITVSTSAI
jgi:hypothetical protein